MEKTRLEEGVYLYKAYQLIEGKKIEINRFFGVVGTENNTFAFHLDKKGKRYIVKRGPNSEPKITEISLPITRAKDSDLMTYIRESYSLGGLTLIKQGLEKVIDNLHELAKLKEEAERIHYPR